MPNFDFVKEYRKLQPLADDAKIESRQASFEAIKAELGNNTARVTDLIRLAFKLPYADTLESDTWFNQHMRQHSKTFDLEHDREEGGNIASLVLRFRVENSFLKTPVYVVAASFAGRRVTSEKDELVPAAREKMAQLVRRIGQRPVLGKLKSYDIPDLSAEIKAFEAQTAGAAEALIDTQSNAYIEELNSVTTDANAIFAKLDQENLRLATEINILWWHIGGQSYLMDCPLDTIDPMILPFVVGADVATLVGLPPGPYGAYGIIKKALGPNAQQLIKIGDALKSLSAQYGKLTLKRLVKDIALAPLHAAATAAVLDEAPLSGLQFKKMTGLTFDTKLSQYDFALQVYHERLLINDGLLK